MDTVTRTKKTLEVIKAKICKKCGLAHTYIPVAAREQKIGDPFDGFYFECVICRSTLFFTHKEIKEVC